MQRKALASVLVMLLAVTIFSVAFTATANDVVVSITPSGSAKPGETVSVEVAFDTSLASGIGSINLNLSYDSDKLEFVSANVAGSFMEQINKRDGEAIVRYAGMSMTGIKSGTLFTVVFEVKDNAAAGTTALSATAQAYTPEGTGISVNATGNVKIDAVAPVATPTAEPTPTPTVKPTPTPTAEPTPTPTVAPTATPTVKPTVAPVGETVVSITPSGNAKPGETVSVDVAFDTTLASGIGSANLNLEYDSNKLDFVSANGAGIFMEQINKRDGEAIVRYAGMSTTGIKSGTLFTVIFKVKDNAAVGTTALSANAQMYAPEGNGFSVTAAGNIVIEAAAPARLPGDVNDDGIVDGRDNTRLLKYLAEEAVVINLSNADVTGDGNVNGLDELRLLKYNAGMDVVLQ